MYMDARYMDWPRVRPGERIGFLVKRRGTEHLGKLTKHCTAPRSTWSDARSRVHLSASLSFLFCFLFLFFFSFHLECLTG